MDEDQAQHYEGSPELLMFLASTVHDMKTVSYTHLTLPTTPYV